jgi:hypothetical protein
MKRYFSKSLLLTTLFAFALAPLATRLSAQSQDATAESVAGGDVECQSFVCPESHLDWAK